MTNKPGGFAAMDPARRSEVSSEGGRASHRGGNAHEYTSEEAREAGRKGGVSVSRDRAYMAEIGRRGGLRKKPSRRGMPIACSLCEEPGHNARTCKRTWARS